MWNYTHRLGNCTSRLLWQLGVMLSIRWRTETKCIMLAFTRIGFINWPQKQNFTNIYCFSRHNTCFLYEKYQAVVSAFVFHCSYDTNRYQIKCRADRLNPAKKLPIHIILVRASVFRFNNSWTMMIKEGHTKFCLRSAHSTQHAVIRGKDRHEGLSLFSWTWPIL